MNNSELKLFRNRLGMNQEDMAKEMGLRQSTYSAYENGRNALNQFHIEKLKEISEKYQISLIGSDYIEVKQKSKLSEAKDDIVEELKATNELLRRQLAYLEEKLNQAMELNLQLGKPLV